MDKHYGQIVEYIVRKKGFGISELAVVLNVNRRTLYNWFENRNLKENIILKIGMVIKHDFSKELGELFVASDFIDMYAAKSSAYPDNDYWKEKYLILLEKYSETLRDSLV